MLVAGVNPVLHFPLLDELTSPHEGAVEENNGELFISLLKR